MHNVYALGDCCADLERPLPALAQVRCCARACLLQHGTLLRCALHLPTCLSACHPHARTPNIVQVAEQQGRYLAKCLNDAAGQLEAPAPPPFVYRSAGAMASVGKQLQRSRDKLSDVHARPGLSPCTLPPHTNRWQIGRG